MKKVFVCIILNTLASVGGNLYLQVLIDDHIVPLVGAENPVLTGLIKAIGIEPCKLCTYCWNGKE